MKVKTFALPVTLIALLALIVVVNKKKPSAGVSLAEYEEHETGRRGLVDKFSRERVQYEFDMLKSPATSKIPKDIFEKRKWCAFRACIYKTDVFKIAFRIYSF